MMSSIGVRWLEPEPTGADGPNLYNFTYNNPLDFYDADGLESMSGDPGVRDPSYFGCFARCLEKRRCPLSGGPAPGIGIIVGVPTPKKALFPYKPPLMGSGAYTNPASSAAMRCGISGGARRILSRFVGAPLFWGEAIWDIGAECICASECASNPYNY